MKQFHAYDTQVDDLYATRYEPSVDALHARPSVLQEMRKEGNYMENEEYPREAQGDTPIDALAPAHEHRHMFTFALNSNHTALRGCVTCGAAWGSHIQGQPSDLVWHPIMELEEQE